MTDDELKAVVDKHKLWLDTNGEDGEQAALQGINLAYRDLSAVDFRRADFTGAELQCVRLARADLRGAVFNYANMYLADLAKANCQGAKFRKAKLRAAVLSNACLQDCDFTEANMSAARLSRATVTWAEFTYADLSDAFASDVDFNNTTLRFANMCRTDLRYSVLGNARCVYTNFGCANLRDADVRVTDLSTARIDGAQLDGAKLIVIELEGWRVMVHADNTRIGCKWYSHEDWLSFTDEQIANMDKTTVRPLPWWRRNKKLVEAAIETVRRQ